MRATAPPPTLPPAPQSSIVSAPTASPVRTVSDRPLRVLLVEDSALLAQRIAELVDKLPEVQIAIETDTILLKGAKLSSINSSDFIF